jgi:hypothetical protein
LNIEPIMQAYARAAHPESDALISGCQG